LQTSKSSDNAAPNFIGPEKGMLACGYEGIWRLWPVDEIVAKALEYKKR
jgi:hypothetical protein